MRTRQYISQTEREMATIALSIQLLHREGILDQYMVNGRITPANLLKAWREHCMDDEARQERVYTTSAVIQGNHWEFIMWDLFKADFLDLDAGITKLTSLNTENFQEA